MPVDTSADQQLEHVRNEPDFYKLEPAVQREVLGRITPDFRSLPQSEQDIVIKRYQEAFTQSRASAAPAQPGAITQPVAAHAPTRIPEGMPPTPELNPLAPGQEYAYAALSSDAMTVQQVARVVRERFQEPVKAEEIEKIPGLKPSEMEIPTYKGLGKTVGDEQMSPIGPLSGITRRQAQELSRAALKTVTDWEFSPFRVVGVPEAKMEEEFAQVLGKETAKGRLAARLISKAIDLERANEQEAAKVIWDQLDTMFEDASTAARKLKQLKFTVQAMRAASATTTAAFSADYLKRGYDDYKAGRYTQAAADVLGAVGSAAFTVLTGKRMYDTEKFFKPGKAPAAPPAEPEQKALPGGVPRETPPSAAPARPSPSEPPPTGEAGPKELSPADISAVKGKIKSRLTKLSPEGRTAKLAQIRTEAQADLDKYTKEGNVEGAFQARVTLAAAQAAEKEGGRKRPGAKEKPPASEKPQTPETSLKTPNAEAPGGQISTQAPEVPLGTPPLKTAPSEFPPVAAPPSAAPAPPPDERRLDKATRMEVEDFMKKFPPGYMTRGEALQAVLDARKEVEAKGKAAGAEGTRPSERPPRTDQIGSGYVPPPPEPSLDLQGFDSDRTPMQQAKIREALTKNLVNRDRVISRKALVEEKVSSGSKVEVSKGGERRLIAPDGSFLAESQISKTAMDYAEHLAKKSEPTAKPPSPAAQPEGGEVAPPRAEPAQRPAAVKVTRENKQEAIDRLKAKLAAKKSGTTEPKYAAPALDPNILEDVAALGEYYFREEGIQNYEKWYGQLVNDLEEGAFEYGNAAWYQIHDPSTMEGRVALLIPELSRRIKDGRMPTDPREVRKLAESIVGGRASEWIDDLYDSIEGAFNQHRMIFGTEPDFSGTMQTAVAYEDMLGNRTRTIEITERQQFSTPFPLSEGVRYAGDIQPNDLVQEITGGTGNLVSTVPNRDRVIVNEIDPRRVAVLKAIGFTHVTEGDYLKAPERRPNVVETNPPWGSATTGRYAHLNAPSPWGPMYADISERFFVKALNELAEPSPDNPKMSRISALMPTTIYRAAGFRKWLRENHTVRAMVQSPPDAYTKRGTKVDSVLLVVDKGKIPELVNQPAPIMRTDAEAPSTWDEYVEALKPLGEGLSHARVNVVVNQPRAQAQPPAPQPVRQPIVQTPQSEPMEPPPSAAPAQPEAGALHIPEERPPGTEGIEAGPPIGELSLQRRTPDVLVPFLEKMTPVRRKEYEDANASPAFVPYVPRGTYPEAPNATLHPRQTVETRSLAGAPNPELTYKLGPTAIRALNSGAISIEQADGISMAAQAISRGHAALIADDVGVGKAREVAGIVAECMEKFGRKRGLIVTANHNNIMDLEDEFKIFWGLDPKSGHLPFQVNNIAKFHEAKDKKNPQPLPVMDGSVWMIDVFNFAAYQDAIKAANFDYVICDEVHKMKNIENSARGDAWTALHQSWLPRNVALAYLSATPAAEISDFEYLYGLKEWTPGNFEAWVAYKTGHMSDRDFQDLKQRENADLSAREVISRIADNGAQEWAKKFWLGINNRGPMPSERLRPLDFTKEIEDELQAIAHRDAHGGMGGDAEDSSRVRQGGRGHDDLVGAAVSTAELEQIMRELKMDGKYRSMDLWRGGVELDIRTMPMSPEEEHWYTTAVMFIRDVIKAAQKYGHMDKSKKSNIGLIISQAQFAVKRLQFDYRLGRGIEVAKEQLVAGHQPILSLISVNEAKSGEGNIAAIINMINETRRDKEGDEFTDPETIPEAVQEKAILLERAAREYPTLPDPIREVYNAFGEDDVTVVIGRANAAQRRLMMEEFQAGRKHIAVISDAGSTGISLHHIKNTEGQARGRRAMILVDYNWAATDFKQRKVMPITLGAAAEMKFLSTIALRMRQLGAASKGAAEAVGETLGDFEFGDSVDNLSFREAWRLDYIPNDYKMLFRGQAFMERHTSGDEVFYEPRRDLAGVTFKDFSIQLQLMPIKIGNEIFDAFLRRRKEIYELGGQEVGETAASKTARSEGTVLRFRKMQPDLDLYEVHDKANHKSGILVGRISPRMSLILPFLEDGRRKYVTFKAGDTQISGLRLDWQDIPNVVRRIGPAGGVKHTPETALDDMRAGEKIPLANGWKLYEGRSGEREGKIILEGAGMLNTDRGRKLKAYSAAFNSVGNFFHIPPDKVQAFLKEFPIRPETVEPRQAVEDSRGWEPYRAKLRQETKTATAIQQELSRAWNSETRPVKLPNGREAHVFNQGSMIPAEQLDKMLAEPYWQNVVQVLHGAIGRLAHMFTLPGQVERAGIMFPDDADKQSVAYGVNIPHPIDSLGEMIFVSLFGNLESARRIGGREAATAWQFADDMYETIVHEIAHTMVREHGADFEAAKRVVHLGAREIAGEIIEGIQKALEGGSTDGKPHELYYRGHLQYIENSERRRRKVSPRQPTPTLGLGLSQGPSYQRDVRQHDGETGRGREALRMGNPRELALYSGLGPLENIVPMAQKYVDDLKKTGTSLPLRIKIGVAMTKARYHSTFDIDRFLKYKKEFGGDMVAAFRRLASARSYGAFFRPYWEHYGGGNKLTEDELKRVGRIYMHYRKQDMISRGIPATDYPDATPADIEWAKNTHIKRFMDFYKDHIYPMVEADHREAGVEYMSGAEIYFPAVLRRKDDTGEVEYSPVLMPFGLPKTANARKAMGVIPEGWELELNPLVALDQNVNRNAELAGKRALVAQLHRERRTLLVTEAKFILSAIKEGEDKPLNKAILSANLDEKQAARVRALKGTPGLNVAAVAKAVLGGSTVQTWLGVPMKDSEELHDAQTVKRAFLNLEKALREIKKNEEISELISERLRMEAYQQFFDKHRKELAKVLLHPPEEVQHFVPAELGYEYNDLIFPKWRKTDGIITKAMQGDTRALEELEKSDGKSVLGALRNFAIGARLASPAPIIMHANRIIGLSLRLVQQNQTEPARKLLASIPMLNRVFAGLEIWNISKTPEGLEMAKMLAKIGAARPDFEKRSSDSFQKVIDDWSHASGITATALAGAIYGGIHGAALGGGLGGALGAGAGAIVGGLTPDIARLFLYILKIPKEGILGFGGLDLDARVYAALFLKRWHAAHGVSPPTMEEYGTFVTQYYGNYIRGTQTAAIRFLRDAGALVWAGFHIGAIPTELAGAYAGSLRLPRRRPPELPPPGGGGGIPNEPPPSAGAAPDELPPWRPGYEETLWQRLQVIMLGIPSAILGGMAANWLLSKFFRGKGKWPHEYGPAQQDLLHIPVGKNSEVTSPFSTFMPEAMRPYRITGVEGMVEEAFQLQDDPDAYISSASRAWANTVLQESFQSPIWKPPFVAIFGQEPYIRSDHTGTSAWKMGSAGVEVGVSQPWANIKAALMNTFTIWQAVAPGPSGYGKFKDSMAQKVLNAFGGSGRLVDMQENDLATQGARYAAVAEEARGVAIRAFNLPEDERRDLYEKRVKHINPELRPFFSRSFADHLGKLFYGQYLNSGRKTGLPEDAKSKVFYVEMKRYVDNAEKIRLNHTLSLWDKKKAWLANDEAMTKSADIFFADMDRLDKRSKLMENKNAPPVGISNPFHDLMDRLSIGPPGGRL